MIVPRLLTAAQARRYLSGLSPEDYGVRPCASRLGPRYDRAALDARLDQLSGLARTSLPDDADSALQGWLEQRRDGSA